MLAAVGDEVVGDLAHIEWGYACTRVSRPADIATVRTVAGYHRSPPWES
jgi:hypothetical protein